MTSAFAPLAAWLEKPKHQWLLAGAALAVFVVLAWIFRSPGITALNDDAEYVLLAKALAQGAYRNLYVLGAPHQAQYPPVYPMLLVLLGVPTGFSLAVFQAANVLLYALGLALLYDAARRCISPVLALVVLGLVAINPELVISASLMMSEGLYFTLSAVTIWLLTVHGRTRAGVAWAIAAAVAATLTRTIGITLIAACLLWLLSERRWRTALVAAVASAIPVGAWMVWTVTVPGQAVGRSYIADSMSEFRPEAGLIGTVLARLKTNLPTYAFEGIPWRLPALTVQGTVLDNLFWFAVIVGLGGLGVWVMWSRLRMVSLYLVSYFGLLAVWAWIQNRYLVPVLPLILLAILVGVWQVQRRWAPRAGLVLGVVLVAVLVGRSGHILRYRLPVALGCDRSAPLQAPSCFNADQRALFAGALAGRDLPEDAVVLAAKGASFAYYSERRVLYLEEVPDGSAALPDRLLSHGVQYVFLGRNHWSEWQYLARDLQENCDRLHSIGAWGPHSRLFRITDLPQDDAPACQALDAYLADETTLPVPPVLWW